MDISEYKFYLERVLTELDKFTDISELDRTKKIKCESDVIFFFKGYILCKDNIDGKNKDFDTMNLVYLLNGNPSDNLIHLEVKKHDSTVSITLNDFPRLLGDYKAHLDNNKLCLFKLANGCDFNWLKTELRLLIEMINEEYS